MEGVLRSGVYAIGNNETGRLYIGSSFDIRKRWNAHKAALQKGNHHSRKLQEEWNTYGESAFSFEVICKCPDESLIEREVHYIVLFDSCASGLNMRQTAIGGVCSPEGRERIRNSLKGNKYSLGVSPSAETRRKISEASKKLVRTEAHKKNQSDANKKRWAERGDRYRAVAKVRSELRQWAKRSAQSR